MPKAFGLSLTDYKNETKVTRNPKVSYAWPQASWSKDVSEDDMIEESSEAMESFLLRKILEFLSFQICRHKAERDWSHALLINWVKL